MTSSDVVRWGDAQQYKSAPMPEEARGGIVVTLIDAPVDPLGTVAVLAGIYEGRVARSKAEVDDDARRAAWDAMRSTVLNGADESVVFTFLIEGIDRALTHQLVRNRFSFVAQESLRFAVKEDWAHEIPLPPFLSAAADDDPRVRVWQKALVAAEDAYGALVANGMPAEEARGLLPHAVTTRLYWTISLRTLLMEAGKRTCTQAQFPWRQLFAGIAKALRGHALYPVEGPEKYRPGWSQYAWQYELFAKAIRPVCYQDGRCGFMAKFDRGCTIRSRVDRYAANNIPGTEWGNGVEAAPNGDSIPPIHPWEWATDPGAARVTEPVHMSPDHNLFLCDHPQCRKDAADAKEVFAHAENNDVVTVAYEPEVKGTGGYYRCGDNRSVERRTDGKGWYHTETLAVCFSSEPVRWVEEG